MEHTDLPGLEAKRRFLRSPEAHGGNAVEQEIETHMSCVYLCADEALKLKKPVRYPFLDFSSEPARGFYCREEVRLNARLAPGVYRGVSALQWDGSRFALRAANERPAADQTTVDWLVAMRRLPSSRMLAELIERDAASPGAVDALAHALAAFYREAAAAGIDPDAHVARIAAEQSVNRGVLLRQDFADALPDAATACISFDAQFAACASLLRDRAVHGHIVEGHGDLRPEHVFLLETPVVIDCLEFDPLLRQVDPFDELAFFAMECDMAGAGWIGAHVLEVCARSPMQRPASALMRLYTARKALLRARLSMAHLLDPHPRDPGRWAPLARRYLSHGIAALAAGRAP